jgi:uncharacterized protein (DUF302 family)
VTIPGLVTIESRHDAKETAERLLAEIEASGLALFARVDHAAGAAAAGLALRPTELFVFGNAKGGTPLMQCEQTSGIDLPLKVLVWQDADGRTWLSYNAPEWIAERHAVSTDHGPNLKVMRDMLAAFAQRVANAP